MWELYYTADKGCLNPTIQSFLHFKWGNSDCEFSSRIYTMKVIKHLYMASNLCHKELQKRHPNTTLEVRWHFMSIV